MKQSNKRKSRENTAFLYERLSRDDGLEGESYSIANQKLLLTKEAKDKGYTNLVHFMDDGVSGVTMNRPGLQDMLAQIKLGKASAVFVKDMSRLGRNHLEVGNLMENFFPEYDIRFVAISDNVDSDEGENEMAAFKNIFNEMYARDISKKRRLSNKVKGNAGIPLGNPPYGYIKDPDNTKQWIVDKEAAANVKRIYALFLEGYGTFQIADTLYKEKVFTPLNYLKSKGIRRGGNINEDDPCRWSTSTVTKILSLQEYCGDVINFKTYSKSFKQKKRLENAKENIMVFKDVHEPIIERSVWELVQEKRGKARKRKNHSGEKNMFSGLLVCPDCGYNLNYHFNQANPDIKYFNCSRYNKNKDFCTATHYVRVDFLEEVVLKEIKRLTKFASKYEDAFVKAVLGHAKKTVTEQQALKEKQLKKLLARDKELDVLFEKTYEDNVAGKLTDERFSKLSKKYETEQAEISVQVQALQEELDSNKSSAMTTDLFIKTVRKYTRIRKLTPRMLNELIEKIEVHHAEKINGEKVQRLTIYYNCVGSIEIPGILPEPEVEVHTRQGVSVNYTPSQVGSSLEWKEGGQNAV